MNTMQKIISTLALTAIFCTPVYAGNWQDTGFKGPSNTPIFIDISDLKRNGNLLSAWLGSIESDGPIVMHYSINCPTRQFVLVKAILKGVIVKWPNSGKLETPAQDDGLYTIATAACAATTPAVAPKRKAIPYHAPQVIQQQPGIPYRAPRQVSS